MFSFKNLIDHDRLWPILNAEAYAAGLEEPIFEAWPSIERPLALLKASAELRERQFKQSNAADELSLVFANRKALPCALFFLPTTVGVESEAGPVPTILRVFYLMKLGHIKIIDTLHFGRLNRSLHHIPVSGIIPRMESFIRALVRRRSKKR